jgi:ankyrin repeat protein
MADVFEAMESGDVESVRALVSKDPAAASTRDQEGLSAVLHALYRGREEMVAVLLAAGSELDVFDASAVGDTDRVKALLHADPELVNAWSADGFSPVHLAVFFGHAATAGLLIERGADIEAVSRNRMTVRPLHSAVAGRDPESVRVLLDAGADVNAPSHAGFTPLLDAAQNGDREIVEMLLADGADASASLDDGQSAADLAKARGHEAVASLLSGGP